MIYGLHERGMYAKSDRKTQLNGTPTGFFDKRKGVEETRRVAARQGRSE